MSLAANHAVPAIYLFREFAEAGGLLSYGASFTAASRQLGVYAGWAAGSDTPGQDFFVVPPDEETLRRTTPAGTPADVAQALRPMAAAFGERKEFHLIVRLHYPGMDFDTAGRAIELFAEKVIPALKGA